MEIEEETDKNLPPIACYEREGYLEIGLNRRVFLRKEAAEFERVVEDAVKNGTQKFMVNFNRCEYISSEGLGVIADFWRKCSEEKDLLVVALFSDDKDNTLLNFFEIIGLARVMSNFIFTDYAKAKKILISANAAPSS